MAAGFVGLFGLVGCQQQTSNTNATVNVSSEATASAYSSGGSVATTDYAYSDAQPDNVNLDLVMTLEDAARFEKQNWYRRSIKKGELATLAKLGAKQ